MSDWPDPVHTSQSKQALNPPYDIFIIYVQEPITDRLLYINNKYVIGDQ